MVCAILVPPKCFHIQHAVVPLGLLKIEGNAPPTVNLHKQEPPVKIIQFNSLWSIKVANKP